MPRGYPDYFGQSIIPRYGSAKKQDGLVSSIAHGSSKWVLNISTKGIIHGGYVAFSNVSDPQYVTIIVFVDLVNVMGFGLHNIMHYFNTIETLVPVFPVIYDTAGNEYCIGLHGELPFESQYGVSVSNQTGSTINLSAMLYYSEIT